MSKTNPLHPKAIEAAINAEARRAERASMKARVQEHRALGIKFHQVGNYTIAYKKDDGGHSVYHIATALRAPGDNPDKLVGEYLAGNRFRQDSTIVVKCRWHNPKAYFGFMFEE